MSKILIYDDLVTSRFTIKSLENSLRRKVNEQGLSSVSVETIDPGVIRQDDTWHTDAALFCLPGGRSRDFREHLQQEGNDSICRYVNQGGTFAGFCAGAFHAAQFIDFDYHNESIRDLPGLGLFPGKCVGPIKEFIPHFDATGIVSARLVDVQNGHKKSQRYQELYWGGPQFIFDGRSNPEIKSHYCYTSFQENNHAVISFSHGEGTVFLSSVHIEIQREDFLEYCKQHMPGQSREVTQVQVNTLFPETSLRTPALEDLFKLCRWTGNSSSSNFLSMGKRHEHRGSINDQERITSSAYRTSSDLAL